MNIKPPEARDFWCPYCGALPKDGCEEADGSRAHGPHQSRRKRALRLDARYDYLLRQVRGLDTPDALKILEWHDKLGSPKGE